MTSRQLTKAIIGKTIQLKELARLMYSLNYRLKTVGMKMIKEEDINLSTDLELYHYVIFAKDGEALKIWFDVKVRDLNDFMNFIVTITNVEIGRKKG